MIKIGLKRHKYVSMFVQKIKFKLKFKENKTNKKRTFKYVTVIT